VLFGEGYAVVRRAGQTVEKTEPVAAAQTTAEESPFQALFGEGYDFLAPHDVCVDSTGALYVGEVIQAAARTRGGIPHGAHALQKFVPVAGGS